MESLLPCTDTQTPQNVAQQIGWKGPLGVRSRFSSHNFLVRSYYVRLGMVKSLRQNKWHLKFKFDYCMFWKLNFSLSALYLFHKIGFSQVLRLKVNRSFQTNKAHLSEVNIASAKGLQECKTAKFPHNLTLLKTVFYTNSLCGHGQVAPIWMHVASIIT